MKSIKDSLYAFVVGDAMGAPVEFMKREELIKNPVKEMHGYGTHNMSKGTFTDDTSMTLAEMDSITTNKSINYDSIADNFLDWLNDGKYTADGFAFDVGFTTSKSLVRYSETHNSNTCGGKDIQDNGNGSLMRMLPIAFYSFNKNLTEPEILEIVKNTSSITHAHEISVLACYIYVRYIIYLLQGFDKFASLEKVKDIDYSMFNYITLEKYKRILKYDIYNYKIDEIKSSGYVIDTLEAVLWVSLKTNNLKEAIITAVNLGDDTDTVAAITGSIAGILYGYKSIPINWLKALRNKKLIDEMIDKFDRSFI